MPFSVTGMIHTPQLSKQFATHFSTLDDFFADAEQGRLPAYSFIEPNLLHAHNDYHPALNAVMPGASADPPSSILGGEELLARIYSATRASSSAAGSHSPTPCSWSPSTSTEAPTTTSRRRRPLRPTRPPRPGRWAFASTAPASASPRSRSPPTSTQAPS
jgi:Phosphoesterase family